MKKDFHASWNFCSLSFGFLLFFIFNHCSLSAQSNFQCEELFISEYRDGLGNDDLIELYNPSDSSTNLNNYLIEVFENGGTSPIVLDLTGTIGPKETFVVSHPDASPNILALSDTLSMYLAFDGNDAIALSYSGNRLDLIGEIGIDPGPNGWPIPGGYSTTSSNIKRKYTVQEGVVNWSNGRGDWMGFQPDSLQNVTFHENICVCEFSDSPTREWFINDTKETFTLQPDIYIFRLENGQPFIGTMPTTVDSIEFQSGTGLKQNVVYFKPSSSPSDRQSFIDQLRSDSLFVLETQAVTLNDSLSYANREYFFGSDLINVVFKKPSPSGADIQRFSDRFGLTPVHIPDSNLPTGGDRSWSYQFKVNQNGCPARDVFKTSYEIFANDSLEVKAAEPWLEPGGEVYLTSPPPNPYYDYQWHILNNGQCLAPSGGNGTMDADCDIEEAWTHATGNNIRVAVIDKGIFNNNHPDISPQYVNGYDFIDNDADLTTCSATSGAHGQNCAGLIAAINNNIGTVGVAYDATIYPYITYFGSASAAFQRACLEDVHVISCSWGWYGNFNGTIESDIINARNLGRNGKGILTVAAAGNDGFNNGNLTGKMFPASLESVVGVIASDPSDRLKVSSTWQVWGSNFGEGFNVSAPGTHLISTDLLGTAGYNSTSSNCPLSTVITNDYSHFWGTSAATPIASGVCALIFESNPNYTAADVQNILEATAEKVGPYNYNSDGFSTELAFGRINAFQSVVARAEESPEKESAIQVSIHPVPSNDILYCRLKADVYGPVDIEVFDLLGVKRKDIAQSLVLIPNSDYTIQIETDELPNGIYHLLVKHEQESVSSKFILKK